MAPWPAFNLMPAPSATPKNAARDYISTDAAQYLIHSVILLRVQVANACLAPLMSTHLQAPQTTNVNNVLSNSARAMLERCICKDVVEWILEYAKMLHARVLT